MSLHTNCHFPRTNLSGIIHNGTQTGLLLLSFIYYYLLLLVSVNIKPPRHRLGLAFAGGWRKRKSQYVHGKAI